MYSKFFCIVLLCVAYGEKAFVLGLLDAEGIIGSLGDIDHEIEDHSLTAKYDNLDRHNVVAEIEICGGRFNTLKHTSAFVLNLSKNQAKHCTWMVEAPANKRVAVFNIQNVLTFDDDDDSKGKEHEKAFDDALNLSVYDGDKVNASKLLFSINDCELHAVSSERKLTIDVDYKKSSVYNSREIFVRFGFI
ncbi:uncharacterized protein LOC100678392 isoform X1 [Nasonia vitripennis]|uniref:CUB domain-containing protein n=1 Tax=Nasonia vitripennis TaxID=7425 RepID=A0A7M7LQD3_NASVI|nr:uncharacterized protein LOC100678392 isoform X1 [Nasonia vitripennis]